MPASVSMDIARPASRLPRRRQGGFALLITITLLAFLVLLLVSLASLTRVETQVASNNQSIAQARQNALLALNLALGQLQKHAGPDQRVTARADVQPLATTATPSPYPSTDPASGVNLGGATTTVLGGIDSYWRASRNRQWTGVWRNRNTPDYPQTPAAAAYDPDAPANFNPVPALQSWLVSGNESIADKFKPTGAVPGLTAASTALDRILDASGAPHRLLVKASAGVAASADLDRAVTAPEMEIRSTAAPGIGGTDTVVGHYAWWVGDEGVKARANLVDPYAAAGTTEANRTRLQSAQRPAIEAMTANGTDGLAGTYPANNADLLNVFTPSQLAYLSTSATFPSELKSRFHALSVSSRGVLADAKHGGLKGDLSYLLGQPTQSDFLTALRTFYGTNAVSPLNTVPGDLSANPLLTPVSTLLATFPSDPSGGTYNDLLKNTATWEQLWSFANQGSSFNASGQASPRRHTATQHGLYPLVIQTKMFFRLRIVGGAAVADPDGTLVNRTGTLSIDCLPLIVLANPYAVPLAAADYQVRISGSNPQLVFGSTDNTTAPSTDFATRAYPNTPSGNSTEPTYAGNITFVLRSTGMAAGEAQIFTIDPDPAVNTTIVSDGTYDRIVVASSSDTKRVYMKNDFDPVPSLTFNTPKTIPAGQTRAALRLGKSGLNTILYMDYVPADPQGYRKLIQFTNAQGFTADTEFTGSELYMLVVDPMADGIRQGGGVNSMLNQPPTTNNPAAKPGTSAVFFSHQQAPFLQVNYRTMMQTWNAPNSAVSHPLEWARRFSKNGSTGSAGDTPNPWFGANLLRPSGSSTTVRWGLVNIGEGSTQTVPPASIGGSSAPDVGFNNYLYDIPRPGRPLASLGQLQHLNTTGYIPDTSIPAASSMNTWQCNYPLSNSYPQPRVPRDQLFNYVNSASVSLGYHFDGSSLWNDLLWDRFTFSTFPQSGAFDFATDKLVNSRYRPFRDRTAVPWNAPANFRGDGLPASAANSRVAAQNLLVDGAFNINSTSVEAWKAVFSSLKNVPVGTETTPSAPFSRTLTPTAGSAAAATGTSPDSWAGFRNLSNAEVQSLADEMVMQIRKRGPFLSLADFVNRRLIKTADDTFALGLSGALQAALDRAVNQTSRLTPAFNVKSSAVSSTSSTNPNHIAFSEIGYILPAALAGFPGYVLQGDVLSALGPTLSARSDTFTIRTYGDATNPATGEVTGRAWCEAVVQRLPDYVDPAPATGGNAPHEIPAAGSDNEKFGRRFQLVSFRWLSPEDV